MSRNQEIKAAVDACEIDEDRVEVLNAFLVLRDAHSLVEERGVLGTATEILGALAVILGDTAVIDILGESPRVTETIVAARAVAARLDSVMSGLLEKLSDLTATVDEG